MSSRLERYLVELDGDALRHDEVQAIAARSREAARALQDLGAPVRFLRVVYVPEDERCFLIYEAPSRDAALQAAERAALAVTRVEATARLGVRRAKGA